VPLKIAAIVLAASVALAAAPARAQKDVADPLEHFLSTRATDGAQRTLEHAVLRLAGDFNNDGLPDVALWQPREFLERTGPVFLYILRKDGRYAAAGSVMVDARMLFRVVAVAPGQGRLEVCGRDGYDVEAAIVTERKSEAPFQKCPEGLPAGVQVLDPGRYRANGTQAWIAR
jgi:hypothetical protein